MDAIDSKRLLSVGEAAELLSVSVPTIWRWNKDHGLPAMRVVGRVLFDQDELIAWAKKGGKVEN